MTPVPLTQVHPSEADNRPKDTGQHRFSLSRFLAWFLFFFYFSGVHQTIIYASGIADFFGVTQALIMSLLWLVGILLVLGLGNILLRDEGVGVRVVEAMDRLEVIAPVAGDGGGGGLRGYPAP